MHGCYQKKIAATACCVLLLLARGAIAFLGGPPGRNALGGSTTTRLFVSTHSHTNRNFYAILQVNRKANDVEIKEAYRRLAKLYHPDSNLNEDTTTKFQELNRAYEVLSDPSLKKMYDMFGESGIGTSAASDSDNVQKRRRPTRGRAASPYGDTFGGVYGGRQADTIDPDIYNTYFNNNNNNNKYNGESSGSAYPRSGSGSVGGMGSRGYSARTGLNQFVGDDVCIDFEIDFRTSILGGEAEVYVRSLETCESCGGTGTKLEGGDEGAPSDEPGVYACANCDGTGVVTQVTQTPLGKFQSEQSCPVCGGTGKAVETACTSCDGKGSLEKTKAIKVTIPAGVDTGSKLQVCGEGDAGPDGGPSGDLFIFLKIQEDPVFRREGSDIYAEHTISCMDAILGNDIRVPIIDGETTIQLAPGTQPGHTVCLKGSGAPSLIGNLHQRGDHYLKINVEIPKSSTDEEGSLVSLLKEQSETLADPSAGAAGSTDSGFSGVEEQETQKVEIEFASLEDLRKKAAEAKTERSRRRDLEDLAEARQKEIEELGNRLASARKQLREETEQKLHFEEMATSRQNKLKEHARRLEELRSFCDDETN